MNEWERSYQAYAAAKMQLELLVFILKHGPDVYGYSVQHAYEAMAALDSVGFAVKEQILIASRGNKTP